MSRKVTIIGAGSVGSTITYTMAVNGLASEIVMIDVNTERALGEAGYAVLFPDPDLCGDL